MKGGDPLTLLNLACLKHTGCLLPISDFGGSNWVKKVLTVCDGDEIYRFPNAKWFPHPYFNPLHLYYPSDDFGVRVLRSLLVDEIKFCSNPASIATKDTVKSLANPYGYKGVVVKIQLDFNSLPAKISRMFHPEREPHQYPHFGGEWNDIKSRTVIHHPRTQALDEGIMRRKMMEKVGYNYRHKYDIWTQKGDLRKKKDTVDILYNLQYLAIGMSYTGDRYYFQGFNCSWWDIEFQKRGAGMMPEWRFKGKNYYEWIEPIWKAEPKLTPDDFIRIYNPSSIDKQEKINQALIANFPKSSHH